MSRPTEIECEVCGGLVPVGPRGPVPRRHRPVCPEVDAPEPEPEPVLVEPARRRLWQVAPIVWVDDEGRRYTSDAADGWPSL